MNCTQDQNHAEATHIVGWGARPLASMCPSCLSETLRIMRIYKAVRINGTTVREGTLKVTPVNEE